MNFLRNLIFVLIFTLLVFVIYSFLAPRLGFGADNIVYGSYLISHDSDHADAHEISLGYKKLYPHKQYIGFSGGSMIFKEQDEDVEFAFLNLTGRYNFTNNYYLEGDLRFYNSDEWNPIVGNLSAVAQKEKLGRIELFVEKSIIDSHAAIARELMFATYGISVDYFITDELTATGVLFKQFANDDNQRLGRVAQLVYSPKRFDGAYVKIRGKWREADFNPPEYFTPAKYRRYDVLVGYATAFWNDNWIIKAEVGPGYQYINDIGETGYEYRIELKGWITQNWKLESFYASTTDAGDEDYRYNWGGVVLKYYY